MNKRKFLVLGIIIGVSIFVFSIVEVNFKVYEKLHNKYSRWRSEKNSNVVNNSYENNNNELNGKSTEEKSTLTETSTNKKSKVNPTSVKEDFISYLNTSITKSNSKMNIAVTIVDDNSSINSSFSSSIANVYNQYGKNGYTGLIRNSFVKHRYFNELLSGNSEIIEKLKLSNYCDYLALGMIDFTSKNGAIVDGTISCKATLSMKIISSNSMSLINSFTISENGIGVNSEQAQEAAVEKILSTYYNQYSSL